MSLASDLLLLLGSLLVVAGVGAYDWRAGLVAGGAAALTFGVVFALGGGDAGKRDS
jgi:hypothetical protein